MSYKCLICGYPGLRNPPKHLITGGSSYEICPSCFFEFGYDDEVRGVSYEEWRKKWIDSGMPWKSKGIPKPINWNPEEQLLNLDLQYFD